MNLRVLRDTSNFVPLTSLADIFNLDNITVSFFFESYPLKTMYLNFVNDVECFQSLLGLLFSFRAIQYVNYLLSSFSKFSYFLPFFVCFVFIFVNLYYYTSDSL